MFSSISLFIRQWFNAMARLGSAADHAAGAVEALAITAEETALAYKDEAAANRAKKNVELEAEFHVASQKAKAIKAA